MKTYRSEGKERDMETVSLRATIHDCVNMARVACQCKYPVAPPTGADLLQDFFAIHYAKVVE